MKSILKIFVLILTLFAPVLLSAQDCTDYHQYHCLYADYTFFYSRQSKSALFRQGQTSELKVVTYSDEDYYIAVCAHRKFGEVHFRLLEDTPEKKVIYDNATDNFSESITFTNQVTRNMIIEISVPEGETKTNNDRRCVGVVIQFRKTD